MFWCMNKAKTCFLCHQNAKRLFPVTQFTLTVYSKNNVAQIFRQPIQRNSAQVSGKWNGHT